MTMRRFVWLRMVLSGAVPLLLMACGGGSGSSGFDAGPAAENAAIQRALAAQRCEMHAGLVICPAREGAGSLSPTPGMPAAATPTPGGAPVVQTSVDRQTPIACVLAGAEGCRFTLAFIPQGFPSAASFRVAVRRLVPESTWHITGPAAPSNAPDGTGSLIVPVDAAAAAGQPAANQVQLAVLVFLAPPGVLPETVTELVETGADYAFVTDAIALAPMP